MLEMMDCFLEFSFDMITLDLALLNSYHTLSAESITTIFEVTEHASISASNLSHKFMIWLLLTPSAVVTTLSNVLYIFDTAPKMRTAT